MRNSTFAVDFTQSTRPDGQETEVRKIVLWGQVFLDFDFLLEIM